MRKRALDARRNLSVVERQQFSRRICDTIIRSGAFMSAKTVACYLPMHDEVDPTAIIERAWRAKKRVFAPVTGRDRIMNFIEIDPETVLNRNEFGLWEPASQRVTDVHELDIVITPLVAFDAQRNRIGMGGGYFDRCFQFLKNRRKWLKPKLIGVAYTCQEVPKIIPEPWDVALYRVVTEHG